MQQYSRTKKVRAEREEKRKERLIIFRYAANLFRFVDTLYRFFRMML